MMRLKVIVLLSGLIGFLMGEIFAQNDVIGDQVSRASVAGGPDFLIIGTTKCGSTSLYQYLVEHPKIMRSRPKEFHFFDRDDNYERGFKYYNGLFPVKERQDQLVAEATPCYLWKSVCLERVALHCPKTKLVVILRNPVKRAISHYFFFYNNRWNGKTFEEALKLKGVSPYHEQSNWHQIVEVGYYYDHLERWLKHYKRDQIHIVILEDLIAHPEQEVNKVFKFLGLNEYKLDSYEPKNKGKYPEGGSITPESIELLERVYDYHNKKLEALLGRKLPWGGVKRASLQDMLDDEAYVAGDEDL